jgi:hypothetical protein
MTIAILALVLGLVIATAAIGIPRVVAIRKNDPEDHADSTAYLRETGRSAQDIARDNAEQADGSGRPSPLPSPGRSDFST